MRIFSLKFFSYFCGTAPTSIPSPPYVEKRTASETVYLRIALLEVFLILSPLFIINVNKKSTPLFFQFSFPLSSRLYLKIELYNLFLLFRLLSVEIRRNAFFFCSTPPPLACFLWFSQEIFHVVEENCFLIDETKRFEIVKKCDEMAG